MENLLEREIKAFEDKKAELLAKFKGKFALIKEDEVIDIFDTEDDAVRHGYEKFGNVPFLVKYITDIEMPISFSSNLIRA